MKIYWLVADDYWGGVFPVSFETCRQARLAGHDSWLLMVCKPAHALPSSSEVPLESLELHPDAPEAPAAILNWLTAHDFDAVVLNCCGEADLLPPYLPESIRCIYVVHNSPQKYWIPAVRHARHLDLIVAISDYVAGIVRPQLKFTREVVTIHNGSTYPPLEDVPSERPEDLLFMGGDEPRKGAGDLLKVWKALGRLGIKGRLHWCGNLGKDFSAAVNALPAREQIVIHGRVPREEVFRLAGQSKILLMLSRAEAFGMITIETMSMGCLPVAWDVNTGTKEIARPGFHGFFAPLGNYRRLAEVVLEAGVKQPSLAAGAMARARTMFSARRVWADYEQSLGEVFKHPRAPRPLAGHVPPKYVPPLRPSHILPIPVRTAFKQVVQKNPKCSVA